MVRIICFSFLSLIVMIGLLPRAAHSQTMFPGSNAVDLPIPRGEATENKPVPPHPNEVMHPPRPPQKAKQEVDPTDVLPSPKPPPSPMPPPSHSISPRTEGAGTEKQLEQRWLLAGTLQLGANGQTPELEAQKTRNPVEMDPIEVDPNDVLKSPSSAALGHGFESISISEQQLAPTSCVSESMPFHLLRSIVFFLQSKDGAACSAAVGNIRSLKETYGSDAYGTLKNPAYLSSSDHILARRMVEAYVQDCSKGLQESAVSKLLTLDNQIRAAKNIGILTTQTQRCMGAIVNSRVLTARHCVAAAESNSGVHQLIPEDATVEFETLSRDHYTLGFKGSDRSPLREDQRDRDWISLAIDPPINVGRSNSLGYDPNLAQAWQPLVLISMSPYVMALRNDFKSSTANAVIDISPVCDILAKDGDYVFHACQTLAGMSGAPLLTMKDGVLTVVGVHTGDTKSVQTPCAQSVAARYVNYGVVPPLDLGATK